MIPEKFLVILLLSNLIGFLSALPSNHDNIKNPEPKPNPEHAPGTSGSVKHLDDALDEESISDEDDYTKSITIPLGYRYGVKKNLNSEEDEDDLSDDKPAVRALLQNIVQNLHSSYLDADSDDNNDNHKKNNKPSPVVRHGAPPRIRYAEEDHDSSDDAKSVNEVRLLLPSRRKHHPISKVTKSSNALPPNHYNNKIPQPTSIVQHIPGTLGPVKNAALDEESISDEDDYTKSITIPLGYRYGLENNLNSGEDEDDLSDDKPVVRALLRNVVQDLQYDKKLSSSYLDDDSDDNNDNHKKNNKPSPVVRQGAPPKLRYADEDHDSSDDARSVSEVRLLLPPMKDVIKSLKKHSSRRNLYSEDDQDNLDDSKPQVRLLLSNGSSTNLHNLIKSLNANLDNDLEDDDHNIGNNKPRNRLQKSHPPKNHYLRDIIRKLYTHLDDLVSDENDDNHINNFRPVNRYHPIIHDLPNEYDGNLYNKIRNSLPKGNHYFRDIIKRLDSHLDDELMTDDDNLSRRSRPVSRHPPRAPAPGLVVLPLWKNLQNDVQTLNHNNDHLNPPFNRRPSRFGRKNKRRNSQRGKNNLVVWLTDEPKDDRNEILVDVERPSYIHRYIKSLIPSILQLNNNDGRDHQIGQLRTGKVNKTEHRVGEQKKPKHPIPRHIDSDLVVQDILQDVLDDDSLVRKRREPEPYGDDQGYTVSTSRNFKIQNQKSIEKQYNIVVEVDGLSKLAELYRRILRHKLNRKVLSQYRKDDISKPETKLPKTKLPVENNDSDDSSIGLTDLVKKLDSSVNDNDNDDNKMNI